MSDETCSNGVVDAVKDEACDDGNVDSGDGCSPNWLQQWLTKVETMPNVRNMEGFDAMAAHPTVKARSRGS